MKNLLTVAALAIICSFPASLYAATVDCSQIKAEKKRLQCYDANARTTSSAEKTLSESTKAQANAALKALRKIDSATEIGISMRDYSQLVIERISTIDEALRDLPDSDLKKEIKVARDAYVDARTLWGDMFNSRYVSVFIETSEDTYKKYGVTKDYLKSVNSGEFAKTIDMNKSLVLVPVWAAAKSSLSKSEQLAAK